MMAKLLQFSGRDFEQFNRSESRKIKLVLYKHDFQEEILALRKKYGVFSFPVAHGEPFALIRKLPQKILIEADKDARLCCYKCSLDVGTWLTFILVLVFYNRLTKVGRVAEVHVPSKEEIEKQIIRYGMRPEIGPEDVSSAYSELELYESDTLTARTENGDIVVRISPQSSMTEIRSVLPALNKCIRFFRKQEHGTEKYELLDLLNEVLYLSEERGLDAVQILSTIKQEYEDKLVADGMEARKAQLAAKGKYPFTEAYIRKMLERARELGF